MPGSLTVNGEPELHIELTLLPLPLRLPATMDILVEAARLPLQLGQAVPEVTLRADAQFGRQVLTAVLMERCTLVEEETAACVKSAFIYIIEEADQQMIQAIFLFP